MTDSRCITLSQKMFALMDALRYSHAAGLLCGVPACGPAFQISAAVHEHMCEQPSASFAKLRQQR